MLKFLTLVSLFFVLCLGSAFADSITAQSISPGGKNDINVDGNKILVDYTAKTYAVVTLNGKEIWRGTGDEIHVLSVDKKLTIKIIDGRKSEKIWPKQ